MRVHIFPKGKSSTKPEIAITMVFISGGEFTMIKGTTNVSTQALSRIGVNTL